MIEIDKIYNEDCLVGMSRIDDNSIDCIVTDLPYGTTQNHWDIVIPLDKLWEQYKRVCKPNAAIILFSQQPFSAQLIVSNPTMFRYEWIWIKDNATGFLNSHKMPMKIHENILVFYDKLPTYNPEMRHGHSYYKTCRTGRTSSSYGEYKKINSGSLNGDRYPLDVIEFCRDADKLHPTQKPVSLVGYLIRTYTNEYDVVLDSCIGSGTTAIAAYRNNRHFIGFELNRDYFTLAERRIRNEMKQPLLF